MNSEFRIDSTHLIELDLNDLKLWVTVTVSESGGAGSAPVSWWVTHSVTDWLTSDWRDWLSDGECEGLTVSVIVTVRHWLTECEAVSEWLSDCDRDCELKLVSYLAYSYS